MKFLKQTLLTIIVCFALQYFLPWWTLAIGAFGVGYWCKNKPVISFLAGLVGSVILWAGMAYYHDARTHAILSGKIDQILPLSSLLMTAIVGGLVGGLTAMTGSFLRDSLEQRKTI